MIITILSVSIILNLVAFSIVISLSGESKKVIYKDKIVYKEKPVEKVVYRDRVVEKIVEKVVYKDKPIVHEFIKKEEPKVSKQIQELLDALKELKSKKKKSKKDLDNIYTIEKVLPNIC